MIIKEEIGKFIYRYSDSGNKIRKIGTGEIYDDAIDVLGYEYEEIEEKIAEVEGKTLTKIDKTERLLKITEMLEEESVKKVY